MYKIGTVRELSGFKGVMSRDLYLAALRIVKILDEVYGTDRDVDKSDGGFVLVAENVQDVEAIKRRYENLDSNSHEAVDVVKGDSGVLVNAFFLHNNEFGVNVLLPIEIAPEALLRDLPGKAAQHQ